MSRIGLQIIEIPDNVEVSIEKGGLFNHQLVTVTGPKGTLQESIRPEVTAEINGKEIEFVRRNELKQTKSYHGLYRSLINNMVIGVSTGYTKNLEIVGIGYRAENQGNSVIFSLGYSHKITLTPPEGIVVTVEEQTKVKVEGANKQLVGEVAAKIRSYRKPEPYKGKGVKYSDEIIKRKSAKSVS